MNVNVNNKLVSGFTFIKNGLTLGYPVLESILSLEPLCDEVIINVGFDDPALTKDDGTFKYLRDNLNHKKFVFLKNFWNPKSTSKGLVLSEQTNIALKKCQGKICQYIQGDEVIHQSDLPLIHDSIIEMGRNPKIEGLVFNYLHFYGNVDLYLFTRSIYRREVRTIRNGLNIKSWLDAQGFRHADNSKLKCSHINAKIFHYGWARKEQVMKEKIRIMDRLYHGNDFEKKKSFEYQKIYGLKKFTDTHPEIMENWIKENRNDIDLMKLRPKFRLNDLGLLISDLIEKYTNYRIGEYKNYKLI